MLDGTTLIVVPTYNELESLPILVSAVLQTSPGVHILVVDDNSPDGTGTLADRLAAADSRVNVLHRTEKNGLGPAYLAGFDWGLRRGYGYLVEMDADGSHRPEDLPRLLAARNTADLVIGSRWVPGGKVEDWPFYRQLISKSGNVYANLVLGAKIHDITAGFRVYRAELLRTLDLKQISAQGYSFQIEMAWRSKQAGARIVEIPITFVERVHGASKMGLNIVVEALWRVTLWGLQRPFRSHS
jgi:dolichol-phosphate mannosyltransferase